MMLRLIPLLIILLAASVASAQNRVFKVDVLKGTADPLPIAAPVFLSSSPAAADLAADITKVVVNNLVSSGLFREIPRQAHISPIRDFNATPSFADWKAINAQAILTGSAELGMDGALTVQFRLWDVVAEAQLGEGIQFRSTQTAWRRIAHKVADTAYERLTGEQGYFDSRVVFVAETGQKGQRAKRLAVMDQDGANLRYLTDGAALVLAPRFSPGAREVLFTSYQGGQPQVWQLDVDTGLVAKFTSLTGSSFAPRYAPDGKSVVLSGAEGGNTDIYRVDLGSGRRQRLTENRAIDTAPSFSPDGSQIVFESDRGGSQQLYVMPARGGTPKRISFGEGRYGTPVWSPRGDLIAFTKMQGGRFHIGVMRTDGSRERLLTASFLDEGPTWAPNGRVLMFFRESRGANGAPQLYSVDVSGNNLRQIPTPGFASDPSWSKLLP